MKHFISLHGRVLGAALLIAGTTIGAAMLALPIAGGRAGFFPSVGLMLACWLYLVYAAFCILEVNLALPQRGNLITMASTTLGAFGKVVSWSAYLFLLYALNTAYIAGSTSIFKEMLKNVLGHDIPKALYALPLLGVFALLLRQQVSVIDKLNRIGMIGLLICFGFLFYFSLQHIDADNLMMCDLSAVVPALPVMMTAFGYHVVIPSVSNYLHGNPKQIKRAIWFGSLLVLIAYILWQLATLGIVPLKGYWSIETAYLHGKNGAELLAAMNRSRMITISSEGFALFAILTSFLGVSLSLFDCLSDGLKTAGRTHGKWKIFFFTFVPPLYFALVYPRAFLTALEYAGAYGVVTLLALIPALMVWRKRYVLALPSPYTAPGGRWALLISISASIAFIVLEIFS